MKRVMLLILTIGLFSNLVAGAQDMATSQSSDLKVISCDRDFSPLSIELMGGTLLMAGRTGTVERGYIPTIIMADAEGDVLWSHEEAGLTESRVYNQATFLEDGSFAALRPNPGDYTDWTIQCFRDRAIIQELGPMRYMRGLYPQGDWLYAVSAPGYTSARIEKMDFAGTTAWALNFDERLELRGLVHGEGIHVAYGVKDLMDPLDGDLSVGTAGILIAFDDEGHVLWRHDEGNRDEFVGAVLTEQNNVVAMRYSSVDGIVAEYDQNGRIWQSRFVQKNSMLSSVHCIILIDDGYLMTTEVQGRHVGLQRYDRSGTLVKESEVYIGEIFVVDHARLLKDGDAVYLVASGMGYPSSKQEEENWDSVARVTTIQRIDG